MKTDLTPTIGARVTRAVVRLPRLGGQGVLVPGGLVVTAAHCIGWTADGSMVLGDHFREPIVTADGRELVVAPLAVEPVSDLAVLGAMDAQLFYDEAMAFEKFCRATRPVPLALQPLTTFVPLPAYIFTHDQGVVPAAIQLVSLESASLWLQSATHINGGTSGGPVVTSTGRLWGIISNSGSTDDLGPCDGAVPRVHLAAPAWVVRRMVARGTRRALDRALPPGHFSKSSGG